jgi:hypothetical protein
VLFRSHLRRKNEGAEDAHQGDHPVLDPFLQFFRSISADGNRSGPKRRPHGGGKQSICHVHDRFTSSFLPILLKNLKTIAVFPDGTRPVDPAGFRSGAGFRPLMPNS